MKYFLFLFMVLFVSCKEESEFVKADIMLSAIDSINTATQAEEYLQTIDSNYSGFHIKKISETGTFSSPKLDSINREIAKKLSVKEPYYKADFDNNGYTDLLILGGWKGSSSSYPGQDIYFFETLAIMNFGQQMPQISSFKKNHLSIFVPLVKQTDSLPLLVLHQPTNFYPDNPKKLDTIQTRLIYHSGHFIEYNKKSAVTHSIEKIEFAAEPCFGVCPVFQININSNGKACFIAQYYNFSSDRGAPAENKYFEGNIEKSDYASILSILNYIDFPTLKNEYSVRHTDAPGVTLKITYDGEKIKEISDYGQKGTYGLMALYDIFRELRFNQNWKPAKEPEGIRINNF